MYGLAGIPVRLSALGSQLSAFLESFLFFYENREALMALIAGTSSRREAEKRLMLGTDVTLQASAVLELRRWHFTRRESRKFLNELRASLRDISSGVEPEKGAQPSL